MGKTTLAGVLAERRAEAATRFDLEDPDDLARLAEPKLSLGALHGLVVIDRSSGGRICSPSCASSSIVPRRRPGS